jgi:flagellar hook-associated protein 2
MAGIQLGGLASGIDTTSIISQLMAAEKLPRTKLTLSQDATTKRSSLLSDIATKLTALKSANDDLKSVLSWLDTQTVESSDATKVTAVRTAGAAPGSYDVVVSQLASAARNTYNFVSPAADGTLDIANGDGSARTSVSLKAGATIDDAVSAINSSSTSKLYAVNVNGSLVLSAKTTGDGSGFSISGNGVGTQTQSVAGLNAKVEIDGTPYERQTNSITDALPGVTLTLKGKTATGASAAVTVGTPGPDKAAIITKVKTFVTAYNDLVTVARASLTEKPVINASTTENIQKGTLFGDSGLNTMLSQLRTTMGQSFSNLTGLKSMADLGVTTGSASGTISQDSLDGKLTLDEAKFSAALDADPTAARALLGGYGASGTSGFGQAFASILSNYQGSGGLIQARIGSASTDLTDLAARLVTFDSRMDAKQALLEKQFSAMEAALQASNAAGISLSGLLAKPDSSS